MRATRTTIATALRLAARRGGVTAGDLADVAGCSLGSAERNLAALARDGILTRVVPERKGKRLGDWRIVYRMAATRGGRRNA